MKRYLVFHGAQYYPNRGMGDFVDSFDTELMQDIFEDDSTP